MVMIPTIFLQMWQGRDEVLFSETNINTISRMKNAGFVVYSFYGKRATVHVGTDDNQLSHKDAQNSATAYVKGNYSNLDIDLDRCTAIWTKGRATPPIGNPPH